MYRAAITNRHICFDLIEQIKILDKSDFEFIILREKDLAEVDYISLAEKAVNISEKIVLHFYIEACEALNYKKIHLPFEIFKLNYKRISNYSIKGVSVHTVFEAVEAEKMGADYITASHIFPTDCKKRLEPKGLKWLEKVCSAVNIPVYALGGINDENAQSCIDVGARGVCMMSGAMKYR